MPVSIFHYVKSAIISISTVVKDEYDGSAWVKMTLLLLIFGYGQSL